MKTYTFLLFYIGFSAYTLAQTNPNTQLTAKPRYATLQLNVGTWIGNDLLYNNIRYEERVPTFTIFTPTEIRSGAITFTNPVTYAASFRYRFTPSIEMGFGWQFSQRRLIYEIPKRTFSEPMSSFKLTRHSLPIDFYFYATKPEHRYWLIRPFVGIEHSMLDHPDKNFVWGPGKPAFGDGKRTKTEILEASEGIYYYIAVQTYSRRTFRFGLDMQRDMGKYGHLHLGGLFTFDGWSQINSSEELYIFHYDKVNDRRGGYYPFSTQFSTLNFYLSYTLPQTLKLYKFRDKKQP